MRSLRSWVAALPLVLASSIGSAALAQPTPVTASSSLSGTSHVGPAWAEGLGSGSEAWVRAALRRATPSQRAEFNAGRLPIGTFFDLAAVGLFGEAALRPATYLSVRRRLEAAGLGGELDRLVGALEGAERQRFLDGELTPRELMAGQTRARGSWRDLATSTSYARVAERLAAEGELPRLEAALAGLSELEREAVRRGGLSPRRAFELIREHEARRPDVVIIGGGMAGIAAARRLEAEGKRVVILEASEHRGGRVRTDASTFSLPIDVGGAWIHNFFENPTGRIAERLGLELVRDVPETRLMFDGSPRLTPFDDARFEAWEERVGEAAERARAEGRDVSVAEATAGARDPFLERFVANSSHGVTDGRTLSARDHLLMTPEVEDRLVRSGMGMIPEALAHGLDIRTGTPVEGVDWSGERVRVRAGGAVFDAERVIVTTSPAVLAGGAVAFSPALPEWKTEALANLPMGKFGKVMLEFDRDVFAGTTPKGARIYDTTNPRGVVEYVVQPFGENVVIALFGGQLAEDIERMGRERAVEYVKERLTTIFGERVGPAIRRAEISTWNTDPLTRGAFSAAEPGRYEAREAVARPVADKIFFAGEATAPAKWVATIAGAFLSGERAAEEVSRSLAGGGGADPLARFRRADGTVEWKRALRDRALHEAGGLAHFGLALFLKELAVVAATGDRLRIEEFFDSLLETDFYTHYGLFVLGARAGEVAYARFLERHVKPTFVNGVLKTNLALAVGIALPEIVSGRFEGRTFAISVASLGLSSAAVRAGVRSIQWVTSLDRARTSGALARVGLRGSALARLGGWFYTAAELAVVLWVAEEVDEAITEHLDERAARRALSEAGRTFLAAASAPRATPADVAAAARAYREAWTAWRNRLYEPLTAEEARFAARLERAAREAKLAADRRAAALERLEGQPALRASIEHRYGSVAAYADSLVRADEERLARDLEAIGAAYAKARDEHLARIYADAPTDRARDPLAGVPHLEWLAAGGRDGAAGDPYGSRSDWFATLGRGRARSRLDDALGDASLTRPATYWEEGAVLAAARDALRRSGRAGSAAALDDALRSLGLLRAADAALFEAGAATAAPVSTPGLTAPLERATGTGR